VFSYTCVLQMSCFRTWLSKTNISVGRTHIDDRYVHIISACDKLIKSFYKTKCHRLINIIKCNILLFRPSNNIRVFIFFKFWEFCCFPDSKPNRNTSSIVYRGTLSRCCRATTTTRRLHKANSSNPTRSI